MGWSEYLGNYLVFLLEAVTVVAAILIVISGIIASSIKHKGKHAGKLVVTPLHKRYKDLKHQVEKEIYTSNKLKSILKVEKKAEKEKKKEGSSLKKVFIIDFIGDMKASQVEGLREEVNAILTVADVTDEVVVKVESPGGVVHGYGLAAAQLVRIKDANIPLTVLVDKVAASGGYMMASIADKIISSPFAILGSIGVVAQLPNFNRFLTEKGVDVELHTAGKYKRTLTTLGENTEEGREKFKAELNDVHKLFKTHIVKHRENLDIETVGTGEYWFGNDAIELGLVDEIMTSDQYLMNLYLSGCSELYEIKYTIKKGKFHKIQSTIEQALYRVGV
jgi:serine protease SohB